MYLKKCVKYLNGNNLIATILVLIPSAVAIFVFTHFADAFELAKTIVFRLLLSVIGIVCLTQIFKNKLEINKSVFNSKILKTVSLILLVIFVSTIFSDQRLNSIWGTYERKLGLIQWAGLGIYFFFLVCFLNREKAFFGIKVLIFTGLMISIYGILQKLGFDPIFSNFNVDYLEGRIFSTIGNPDFLAQFLAPTAFLSIFFAAKKKSKILLFTSIVILIAIVLTESRASILALLGAMAIWLFLEVKNKKKLLLTSLVIIATFISFVFFETPGFDRFKFNDANLRSIESRLVIWKVAAEIARDYPILGIGPDNLEIYFPSYMKPEFYYLEDDLNISADRAHNEILDMGLIGGIPLILLYLYLAYLIFKNVFNKDETTKAASLALIVILLQNQLSFSQIIHWILFFFLLSILVIKNSKNIFEKIILRKNLKFTTIILVIFLTLFGVKETILDKVYAEAWYTYALRTDDTKIGLQNAISFSPLESEFRYNLLMWYPDQRYEQVQALKLIEGDTINVIAWEANDLLGRNNNEAYRLFEKVINLNPYYPHTTRAYADGLYKNGDYVKATEYYEKYLELIPNIWEWCFDLDQRSDYEKKKYRIFYKNVPDFNNPLKHLLDSYEKIGETEKTKKIEEFLHCYDSRSN